MATFRKRVGSFLIGLYAWVVAISFGMVLVDILYARLAPNANLAFGEVSDFLLMISTVTLLIAIVVIAFSSQTRVVRNLIIASQLIAILEFISPALIALIGLNTQAHSFGPWLRILLSGTASVLAFIGLYLYKQQK